MKIRVAYTEDERDRKRLHEEAVRKLFPDIMVRETAERDGYLHTVLTVPYPRGEAARAGQPNQSDEKFP